MSRRAVRFILALNLMIFAAGCSKPQTRTTFLRSVDLTEMTDRMAQSFVQDERIAQRNATNPPWVISIDRIVNHTNQIIPDREKWLYTGRLRALLDRSRVAEDRSIIWIIPPERWGMVAEELGVSKEPYGLRLDPTHLLSGTFSALTNTSAAGRSDMYLCSYELLDLSSGQIIWSDAWEVKRAASGLTFD